MSTPRIFAIKAEIDADPLGRGYGAMSNSAIATSLNTVDRTRPRSELAGWEIVEAIVPSERQFLAATGSDRTLYDHLVSSNAVDISRPNIRTLLQEIFGGPQFPLTRVAMTALETEPASRAVELGLGPVSIADVEDAQAAP